MSSPRERGWTTGETVIAMVVFGALVFFTFLPGIRLLPSRYLEFLAIKEGTMRDRLSGMRQLQLATQAMALDGITNGNTNLGWPGDTGGSFVHWATMLVQENYLGTNDLCQLLSAPGKITPRDRIPVANTNAILVYAVEDKMPGDTVFFSTANFTNAPVVGANLRAATEPNGTKAFAVLHKDGRARILFRHEVSESNSIGSYAPLCR